MSRSRKKTPIFKVGSSYGKKAANRKLRREGFADMRKGNSYKKAYPQYDVIDYTFYRSKKQWNAETDAEMNRWEKYYRRK